MPFSMATVRYSAMTGPIHGPVWAAPAHGAGAPAVLRRFPPLSAVVRSGRRRSPPVTHRSPTVVQPPHIQPHHTPPLEYVLAAAHPLLRLYMADSGAGILLGGLIYGTDMRIPGVCTLEFQRAYSRYRVLSAIYKPPGVSRDRESAIHRRDTRPEALPGAPTSARRPRRATQAAYFAGFLSKVSAQPGLQKK